MTTPLQQSALRPLLVLAGVLAAFGPASSPLAGQVDPATVAALELRGATTGIVMGIVHEGELALLDTYGRPTSESEAAVDPQAVFPFPWGTQMLTGITARALAANGTLNLDAPISSYLPELRETPVGEATMAHLLEHRGGLPDVLPPPGVEWSQLLDRAGSLELVAPPGATYSRSRVSYPLAIRVLERIVGLPFNEVAAAAVLTPLGMTHSSFSPVTASETGQLMQGYREVSDTVRPVRHLFDASGVPVLYTSAPDLLALAVTWMSGGLQGATPLLPLRDDGVVLGGRRFADGLWMESNRTPPRSWSSDEGLGFGVNLTLYPETRSAVVVAANGRLPTGLVSWGLGEVEVTLLGAGEGQVSGSEGVEVPGEGPGRRGEAGDTPPDSLAGEGPPPPDDLPEWAGTFANGSLRLRIQLDDDGFPLLVEGDTGLRLFRIGDDRWALPGRDGAIPFRFVRVAGAPAIAAGGIVYRRVEG